MKKRTVSLAAAGLALGIVFTGALPAQASNLGTLSCAARWVGVMHQATGTVTDTVVNGPSQSWGKVWPYASSWEVHSSSFATHLASAIYVSTTGGSFFRSPSKGCYDTIRNL